MASIKASRACQQEARVSRSVLTVVVPLLALTYSGALAPGSPPTGTPEVRHPAQAAAAQGLPSVCLSYWCALSARRVLQAWGDPAGGSQHLTACADQQPLLLTDATHTLVARSWLISPRSPLARCLAHLQQAQRRIYPSATTVPW